MTRDEWDRHWQGYYENAREEGATPEGAWVTADRATTEQYGERPEGDS